MKMAVGVVKEIDSLGRIVIPKEFLERMKLNKSVEVVLTKYGVLIRYPECELVPITRELKKH